MTTETNWRDQVHPATALFPMMSDAELDILAEDIKTNGLRTRIILLQDGGKRLILDGRNRLAAIERAGLSVNTCIRKAKLYSASDKKFDPYAFVISVNIHRRHLNDEQRIKLVEDVIKARPELSDRQIAKKAKVSPTTVSKARKKLEQKGHVPTVDTRTDARGRQQPASKPPKKAPAGSELVSTMDTRTDELVSTADTSPDARGGSQAYGRSPSDRANPILIAWNTALKEQRLNFLEYCAIEISSLMGELNEKAKAALVDYAGYSEDLKRQAFRDTALGDASEPVTEQSVTTLGEAAPNETAQATDDCGMFESCIQAGLGPANWKRVLKWAEGDCADDLYLPNNSNATTLRTWAKAATHEEKLAFLTKVDAHVKTLEPEPVKVEAPPTAPGDAAPPL